MANVAEARQLITELCHNFYHQGWVTGTGGGVSIKAADGSIVMAPSGVQKERMRPEDMFVLDCNGNITETPAARPQPYKPPKLSECSPLFMAAYELRGAGAVIHSHSMNSVLATLLDPTSSEFSVTHLEMIKGIAGHGFYSNCVVPIIENTARESELTDRLKKAMHDYPQADAVLVRRHGVYVWGKDWIQAKTQAECYDYLFEVAVKLRQIGIDAARPPQPLLPEANGSVAGEANGTAPAAKRQRAGGAENGHCHSRGAGMPRSKLPHAVVLDIEGTVAPISFVTDVLFPYAKQHLREHLEATWDSEETQQDVELLRQQAEMDAREGREVPGIPPTGSSRQAELEGVVANVEAQMARDRKTTALKALQGHIWRGGFAKGALKGQLFRDVPDALAQWRDLGLKTFIYSSGSRQAQANLFGNTQAGDMRPYLSGFFDTTSGAKVDAGSYDNLALSIGVDSPSTILFATDVHAEAVAARAAGWQAVLVDRPGNKPLPADHGFRVVTSMQELL